MSQPGLLQPGLGGPGTGVAISGSPGLLAVLRWVFYDTLTAESWTMPLNPNAMSAPQLGHSTSRAPRSPLDGLTRPWRQPPQPREWTFGGVIRTQVHHDTLASWAAKTSLVHVSDHYGRTWAVRFVGFDPEERKPVPGVPWRMRYQMRCLTYGAV